MLVARWVDPDIFVVQFMDPIVQKWAVDNPVASEKQRVYHCSYDRQLRTKRQKANIPQVFSEAPTRLSFGQQLPSNPNKLCAAYANDVHELGKQFSKGANFRLRPLKIWYVRIKMSDKIPLGHHIPPVVPESAHKRRERAALSGWRE